jgi:branched-subunit amino acid transport protein
MAQSRSASLAEAMTNVVVGFLVAIAAQQLIFPVFGIATTLAEDGAIAAVFTGASLVRSYAIRRLFIQIETCRASYEELRLQSLQRRLAAGGKPGGRRP